jgi:hypothetical protein
VELTHRRGPINTGVINRDTASILRASKSRDRTATFRSPAQNSITYRHAVTNVRICDAVDVPGPIDVSRIHGNAGDGCLVGHQDRRLRAAGRYEQDLRSVAHVRAGLVRRRSRRSALDDDGITYGSSVNRPGHNRE